MPRPKKQQLRNFAVISRDDTEGETFIDIVRAESEDSASAIVADVRESAIVADVMDAAMLRKLANAVESLQQEDVPSDAFDFAVSISQAGNAIHLGTPEQLNAWAEQPGIGVTAHLNRRKIVDHELGKRS